MNKYFIVHKESDLYKDYFEWIEDKPKIADSFKKVCEHFGIEAKEFYLQKDRFHIVPKQSDLDKFSKMMTKGGYGEFKKTSPVSKMWIELVKDIKNFNKPHLIYYFELLGHRWKERLFDIDGILYGSVESDMEVKLPEFVSEMKASDFYKVIEEYQERMKS